MNEKLLHAFRYLDSEYEKLKKIGNDLWNTPEIGGEEVFAHKMLTKFMVDHGFDVTEKHLSETGFKATFGNKEYTHAVICCEYDALPKIGHACGHNLIAVAAIGTAIAVKEMIVKYNLPCRLTLLGTPAEENLGGKVWCINNGDFKDVDFAMMVHPRNISSFHVPHAVLKEYDVIFKGRNAHITGCPWEGVNALDAANLAYQGCNFAQKHFKKDWYLNTIIRVPPETDPGIVPESASLETYIRCRRTDELLFLENWYRDIIEGAAKMTRCEVEFNIIDDYYESLVSNKEMLKIFKKNLEEFVSNENDPKYKEVVQEDISWKTIWNEYEDREEIGGSTDMGNVSQVVPSIHPVFKIRSSVDIHTDEFVKKTNEEESYKRTMKQVKLMACLIHDLVTDSTKLEKVKQEFEEIKSKNFPKQSYKSFY